MTDEYEWHYANAHNDTAEEPHVGEIHELARHGLDRVGRHGPVAAMDCVTTTQFPRIRPPTMAADIDSYEDTPAE